MRRISRQSLRNKDSKPVFSHRHKGGGYYEILKHGKVIDTVRGKAKAKQYGAEIADES